MTERKCANCMWWDRDGPFWKEWRECHGAPPVLHAASNNSLRRDWPKTNPDDWCGAFRFKEPEA